MATVLILSLEEMAPLVGIVAESGHRVIEAYDSGQVLQQVMRRRPDVVMVPDDAEPVDGEELLPVVRRLTASAIVAVGPGQETRMANALFQGADAYLRFPVEADNVRSRLRALLRRRVRGLVNASDESAAFLNLVAEGALETLAAILSPVEERLFRRLVEQPGVTVSAHQLAADVWGQEGKGASLRFYIKRLRGKLEPLGLFRILNRKGIGYRVETNGHVTAVGD